METVAPSRDRVLRQLDVVLSSPRFARNDRQSRFLRYVVERQLDGRVNELKESVIGVEVFGRAVDYDPKLDTIVRTEAVRLRSRLSSYYAAEGRQDPLIIELPKGGYRPAFTAREAEPTVLPEASRPRRVAPWVMIAAGFAVVAVVVSVAFLVRRRELDTPAPVRFALDVPPGVTLGHNSTQRGTGTAAPHFAPSPDGRSLAYVAFQPNGKPQLWVRRLDEVTGHPLSGTQDATFPFWSPDSRELAFFAEGKLKKVAASGGPTQSICDAPAGEGGTWNRDGVIVFAPDETGGLFRVSSSGGNRSALTSLDEGRGETSHRWPQFLPDGRHFLYLSMSGPIDSMSMSFDALQDKRAVLVASLESPRGSLVKSGVLRSAYSAGHLLFLRQKTLVAQSFDIGSLRLTGEEIPIAQHLSVNAGNGRTGFAVSDSGVLMYRREVTDGLRQLVWLDRNGRVSGRLGEPADYGTFHLSPDGKRLAAYVREPGVTQLKIFEIAGNALVSAFVLARVQSESQFAWSSDDGSITYSSGGGTELYRKATTGTGAAELILKSAQSKDVGALSRDDRYLAYTQIGQQTRRDIFILPLFGERRPKPFLVSESDEQAPVFSPDGKWVVYRSDKEGLDGLYVRTFPGAEREWKIAGEDSSRPSWRADSKELFYVSRGNVMSIAVVPGGVPAFGAPQKLFTAPISPGRFGQYAVSADGSRFLMIEQQDTASAAAAVPLTVVTNWLAGLGT